MLNKMTKQEMFGVIIFNFSSFFFRLQIQHSTELFSRKLKITLIIFLFLWIEIRGSNGSIHYIQGNDGDASRDEHFRKMYRNFWKRKISHEGIWCYTRNIMACVLCTVYGSNMINCKWVAFEKISKNSLNWIKRKA